MNPVAQLLVIVAGLLLIGALGEFVFSLTGIPDVIWLVLAGSFAGPVFEVVSPRMLEPAVPFFGAIALTIILSGGASHLRLTDVAAAAPRGLLLAFVILFFRGFDLLLFLGAHQARVGQTRNAFIVVNRRCDCRRQCDTDACRREDGYARVHLLEGGVVWHRCIFHRYDHGID